MNVDVKPPPFISVEQKPELSLRRRFVMPLAEKHKTYELKAVTRSQIIANESRTELDPLTLHAKRWPSSRSPN